MIYLKNVLSEYFMGKMVDFFIAWFREPKLFRANHHCWPAAELHFGLHFLWGRICIKFSHK